MLIKCSEYSKLLLFHLKSKLFVAEVRGQVSIICLDMAAIKNITSAGKISTLICQQPRKHIVVQQPNPGETAAELFKMNKMEELHADITEGVYCRGSVVPLAMFIGPESNHFYRTRVLSLFTLVTNSLTD